MRVRRSSTSRASGSAYVLLLLRLRSVRNAPRAQANFVCVQPEFIEQVVTNPAWRTVVTAFNPRSRHFEGVVTAPTAAASGRSARGAVGVSAEGAAAPLHAPRPAHASHTPPLCRAGVFMLKIIPLYDGSTPGAAEYRDAVEDLTAAALEEGDNERLTMPEAMTATRKQHGVAIRARKEALKACVVPLIETALAAAGIAESPDEFAASLAAHSSDPGITSLEEDRVLVRGVEGAAAVRVVQEEAPAGSTPVHGVARSKLVVPLVQRIVEMTQMGVKAVLLLVLPVPVPSSDTGAVVVAPDEDNGGDAAPPPLTAATAPRQLNWLQDVAAEAAHAAGRLRIAVDVQFVHHAAPGVRARADALENLRCVDGVAFNAAAKRASAYFRLPSPTAAAAATSAAAPPPVLLLGGERVTGLTAAAVATAAVDGGILASRMHVVHARHEEKHVPCLRRVPTGPGGVWSAAADNGVTRCAPAAPEDGAARTALAVVVRELATHVWESVPRLRKLDPDIRSTLHFVSAMVSEAPGAGRLDLATTSMRDLLAGFKLPSFLAPYSLGPRREGNSHIYLRKLTFPSLRAWRALGARVHENVPHVPTRTLEIIERASALAVRNGGSMDDPDGLIYVGEAVDAKARHSQHLKSGQLCDVVARQLTEGGYATLELAQYLSTDGLLGVATRLGIDPALADRIAECVAFSLGDCMLGRLGLCVANPGDGGATGTSGDLNIAASGMAAHAEQTFVEPVPEADLHSFVRTCVHTVDALGPSYTTESLALLGITAEETLYETLWFLSSAAGA